MPIMEHLVEVRNRLFKSVAAVIVTTILAFIFNNQIMDILLRPAPDDLILQTLTVMEPLSIFFKVSLTAGIVVAMPYLVYQLFAFVSPALTSKEKRYIYWILPGVTVMFLARMGLVTPKWLAAQRKLWIVLAFVIAALITPTFDPINQTIIALPLIILLELSIWLAKLVYKKKPEPSPAGV
jgi:sec-independent protein translocase protein TatC